MLKKMRWREQGDTIIEVLFATTIFSMIAVGSLSIMNQGTAMAQRALEIGLVRQQINAQADALRYLNQAYVADFGRSGHATQQWNAIIAANAVSQAMPYDQIAAGDHCVLPISAQKPFALNVQRLDTTPLMTPSEQTSTYARVRYDVPVPAAEGIWIQAVRSPVVPGQAGFYDFHIRACWQSPGQVSPMVIATIVRFYEPRS